MRYWRQKRDSQGRKIRWITNSEAMQIVQIEDPSECCGNCRYYDISRGIRKPRCLKHPGLRIVYIGLCGALERKGEQDET